MDPKSHERFLRLVSEQGLWRSVDLRILAVQIGRRWTNLLTRGYLDHRPPKELDRLEPVTRSDLRAWQVILPIKKLEGSVHGIVSGTLRSGPQHVRYHGGSGQPEHELEYRFNDLSAAYSAAEYHAWSGHALIGHGDSMWDIVREAGLDPTNLDNCIRAGPNAFDGLSDLARYFHGRSKGLDAQNSTSVVELIAPLGIRFDQARTSSEAETLAVHMKAISSGFANTPTLHWTVIGSSLNPRHGSVELDGLSWTHSEDSLETSVEIPVEPEDRLAKLFLIIGEKCVDRVVTSVGEAGANCRITAHEVFDAGLERFTDGLLPDERDWAKGTPFEASIGMLLHFLGFQVDALSGQRGASSAVDHLAHDPHSDLILCVECTTGPLDAKGKLGKLLARTEAVRDALPELTVLPVMATARPGQQLSPTEIQKSERDGIVVLARDEIEDLWQAARTGGATRELVGRIQQRLMDVQLKRRRSVGP